MEIGLKTPWAWAFGELYEVIGLFYDARIAAPDGQPMQIAQEEGRFVLSDPDGSDEEPFSLPPKTGDPLDDRRGEKRAIKSALYRLLRRRTGMHPPWGSLTGIRPMRLYYERIAAGDAPEEAVRHLTERFDVWPEKARLLRSIAEMQRDWIQPAPEEIDVYAGIPFCPTRCAYCAFAATALKGAEGLVAPYFDALMHEIDLCAKAMRLRGKRARALYVGGGTPTTLDAPRLGALVDALREGFPGAVECTVEAGRPDTITEEKLRALWDGGVTRLAINPQSMKEETLRRLGRRHTPGQIEEAYALARSVGAFRINMDVIAALPGETTEDFRGTMEAVLGMRPENVTVHTLALKRTSALGAAGARHADPEAAGEMVRLAMEMCGAAGLRPYYLYRQKRMAGNEENVGYALPGEQCVYNIDNMEETAPVLAMGAGAITKWLFDRRRRIERAPNVRDIRSYIARVDEMFALKEALWNGEGRRGAPDAGSEEE